MNDDDYKDPLRKERPSDRMFRRSRRAEMRRRQSIKSEDRFFRFIFSLAAAATAIALIMAYIAISGSLPRIN